VSEISHGGHPARPCPGKSQLLTPPPASFWKRQPRPETHRRSNAALSLRQPAWSSDQSGPACPVQGLVFPVHRGPVPEMVNSHAPSPPARPPLEYADRPVSGRPTPLKDKLSQSPALRHPWRPRVSEISHGGHPARPCPGKSQLPTPPPAGLWKPQPRPETHRRSNTALSLRQPGWSTDQSRPGCPVPDLVFPVSREAGPGMEYRHIPSPPVHPAVGCAGRPVSGPPAPLKTQDSQ